MEINSKFLNILSKLEKLNLTKNVKDAVINDIKELRDSVFNTITDTKSKEPLADTMQEEYDKQHNNVNHPRHYCSHPENKGELIISNISEISLSFKDNLLSLQIKC